MPSREQRFWQHYEENKIQRGMRKQIKRERQPDRVRRRDWLPGELEELDALYDLDVPDYERVMPRGERERRQANLAAAWQEREADDASVTPMPDPDPGRKPESDQVRGTVVEVSSGLCRVEVGGRVLMCSLRGSLAAEQTGATNLVAAGDEVLISVDSAQQGIVDRVLPRRSMLSRPDVSQSHLRQVIAANVDQVLVVASWREPAFWPELVDRYLITAARNRLEPILCVNKIDLAEDLIACQADLEPYTKLGYRVIMTSAINSTGIETLRSVLSGHSTVLAGLSGVGKSSLLAAVQPGLRLKTGEVSERRHEGQHTTTQATLFRLGDGGCVVDTPGIREFGLSGMRQGELAGYYPELSLVAEHCRFANCSHLAEPGCAVKALLRAGWISAMRYDSYKKIYASLPA